MSRRRGRRLAAALTTLAAVAAQFTVAASWAPPAAASWVPDGRSTYVVSLIEGTPGAMSVRLATYLFSPDGVVLERYWAWRQDAISGSGNVAWTKPSSGYTTVGCLRACPVRTPYGFQSGTLPRLWQGRWWMTSDTMLDIQWSSSSPVESWQLDDSRSGFVGARLLAGGPHAQGWGVGSNADADTGVPLATVYHGSWITGPFAENAYSRSTVQLTGGFNPADYTLCSTGHCLQGRQLTSPDKKTWYHTYFAADPARDGRKVYWNNQTGVVQQLEDPKSVCISASGGGHTNALLQALDDDGHFLGFVGVEASLNQRKYGQDIVAAYAMLAPSDLSAIGQG